MLVGFPSAFCIPALCLCKKHSGSCQGSIDFGIFCKLAKRGLTPNSLPLPTAIRRVLLSVSFCWPCVPCFHTTPERQGAALLQQGSGWG